MNIEASHLLLRTEAILEIKLFEKYRRIQSRAMAGELFSVSMAREYEPTVFDTSLRIVRRVYKHGNIEINETYYKSTRESTFGGI